MEKRRIWISAAVISLVMLLANVFPFVSYRYRNTTYTLMGMDFLTGKLIAGGKVMISTSIPMCLSVAASAGILLAALLYPKLKVRVGAGLVCIFSVIAVAGNVVVASKMSKLLSGVQNSGIAFGNLLLVILGMVLLVESLYLLWKEKVVTTLDFMVLPGMLYFIINNYIPMLGIYIAFKKVNYSLGFWKSPWCGFENFRILFSGSGSFFESDAFIITRNTLLYNLAFIIIGTIMGILVGICLADIFSKTLQKFFQTSILLPQLISMVIVAYIVYALFSNETGLVNKMLGDKNAVNFYTAKRYWPLILIFVNTWKQIGYSAIIFLSSIVGIDKTLYEAANVDGASKWTQIKLITLPLLRPTIMTLLLLQVGRIFYSDFGLFYQVPMDSGALYSVTNTIDTYVYRSLMVSNNISTASAVSTYQAVVGFIIVLSVNLLVRKFDNENKLF